jgi:hypothetical protein
MNHRTMINEDIRVLDRNLSVSRLCRAEMLRCFEPGPGVWSLASPQPEMGLILAGTPFESLTGLREIEGVAGPTKTL